jgi:hypothetical protein
VRKEVHFSEAILSARREASRADLSSVFRLAYVSEVTPIFGPDDVRKIGERSMVRNRELDITGILVIDQGKILQILEGDRKTVEDLFSEISKDPRHGSIRQVAGSQQEGRGLSCWSLVSGHASAAPPGLREDFQELHGRLFERSGREGLGEILPQEIELLKVMALFRSVPL